MPFVSMQVGHTFFSQSMLTLKVSSTYLFAHPLCHQTFVFSWVPNISDKLPVAVHEPAYLHFWPPLNPDKVDNQMHRSKSCPLGGFPITTVLLGHPWMNGVVLLQHLLPVDANILCKTICKLGLSFFFLSQLVFGNSPMGPQVGREATTCRGRCCRRPSHLARNMLISSGATCT